ncbi:uncharacterized protein SCHCODRAFT_02693223 [Schizophyllum commune H4-8]|uniref:uncharacterized protein n=1 Tax=Schizophyllum commune (strain H4-8 / FGSC 9210) TaxID=578458 RepID=UPI00215DDE31|nr:uncharacterized protein SCHCODRAFT_02693223 [Schizophyllum commune H4-8]KAI5886449.1 hypothetical protein SCHCODRAFT_02693223 [Schizophyllum commune H4-8]
MSHTFNPNSFFPVPPPQAREAHPKGIHTTYYHAHSAAQPERTACYEDPADRYTAPPPHRNWKRDHKRHESSEHHESSGHHHYHGHSWRKDDRKPSYKHRQDGVYDLSSLHGQGNGYTQDDGYTRDGNGYACDGNGYACDRNGFAGDNGHTQDNAPEDDDIYLARLNALRSFGRAILKTVGWLLKFVGWFAKTIAFVAIMSFAVGCGAAVGVVLLMVGKPLVDWLGKPSVDWLAVSAVTVGSLSDSEDSVNFSEDSLTDLKDSADFADDTRASLPPLHVARAGAVAGAMAFLVPGLLFFLTEVTFAGSHLFVKPRRLVERILRRLFFRHSPQGVFRHSSPPVYANDFARDERMDFVINAAVYVLATLCFAVGVGVWVVILPPGLGDEKSPGLEDEKSLVEDEKPFFSAIQTSLLGWAVMHVGFAGVLGLTMAVKTVPSGSQAKPYPVPGHSRVSSCRREEAGGAIVRAESAWYRFSALASIAPRSSQTADLFGIQLLHRSLLKTSRRPFLFFKSLSDEFRRAYAPLQHKMSRSPSLTLPNSGFPVSQGDPDTLDFAGRKADLPEIEHYSLTMQERHDLNLAKQARNRASRNDRAAFPDVGPAIEAYYAYISVEIMECYALRFNWSTFPKSLLTKVAIIDVKFMTKKMEKHAETKPQAALFGRLFGPRTYLPLELDTQTAMPDAVLTAIGLGVYPPLSFLSNHEWPRSRLSDDITSDQVCLRTVPAGYKTIGGSQKDEVEPPVVGPTPVERTVHDAYTLCGMVHFLDLNDDNLCDIAAYLSVKDTVALSSTCCTLRRTCEPFLFSTCRWKRYETPPRSLWKLIKHLHIHTDAPYNFPKKNDLFHDLSRLESLHVRAENIQVGLRQILLDAPNLHTLDLARLCWKLPSSGRTEDSDDDPDSECNYSLYYEPIGPFSSIACSPRALKFCSQFDIPYGDRPEGLCANKMRATRSSFASILVQLGIAHIEHLEVGVEALHLPIAAAYTWTSLRELVLTGYWVSPEHLSGPYDDPSLGTPSWVFGQIYLGTLLAAMPKLVAFKGDPLPSSGSVIPALEEFELSNPNARDGIFPHLPRCLRALALLTHPHTSHEMSAGNRNMQAKFTLTPSEVIAVLSAAPLPELRVLRFSVRDLVDAAVKDVCEHVARAFPRLELLEIHLEDPRDKMWSAHEMTACADALTPLTHLRCLRISTFNRVYGDVFWEKIKQEESQESVELHEWSRGMMPRHRIEIALFGEGDAAGTHRRFPQLREVWLPNTIQLGTRFGMYGQRRVWRIYDVDCTEEGKRFLRVDPGPHIEPQGHGCATSVGQSALFHAGKGVVSSSYTAFSVATKGPSTDMYKSITQLQSAAIGQHTHGGIPQSPLARTGTFDSDSAILSPTSTERQCGFFYIFVLVTAFRMGIVVLAIVIGHQVLLYKHGKDSSWNVPESGVARAGAIGTAILSLLTMHMWRLLKKKYLLIFFLLNCGLFPAEGAIGAAILRAGGHVALIAAQSAIAALVGGLMLACSAIFFLLALEDT